jgi:putative tryptophan/tyrosine transport system substrate-binding protein
MLHIQRRRFMALLLGAVGMWAPTAQAQTVKKPPLIGWLYFARYDLINNWLLLFLKGMQELGNTEGRDFQMAYRSADGRVDLLPKAAEELIQLSPDIIVAPATIQAVAAKKATNKIPIVVPVLADPITLGFVDNDAHPGGNVTGIAPYVKGLPAKQLELARELAPTAKRIGLLDDVYDPKGTPQRREIEAAARDLGIEIVPAELRTVADIPAAYEALANAHAEVVVVEQSNMLLAGRRQIAESAAAKKLLTVYGYREHIEVGGLVSYGINLDWCFHRSAYYVDKILKGADPADLPLEFPTRLYLSINLKAAKALDFDFPISLLVRADEVIE